MRGIKITIALISLLALGACASDVERVKYNADIQEMDNHGNVLRVWHPVTGSITYDDSIGEVEFKDSISGGTIYIERSYRIIKK